MCDSIEKARVYASMIPIGVTYLLTRKVTNDEHWLFAPFQKAAATILLYYLTISAHAAGLQVHAAVVLSNHIHLIVTDLFAALPHKFLQNYFRDSARTLNKLHGRRGTFWAKRRSADKIILTTPQAILEAMVYVMGNPVHHRVVERVEDYKGFVTRIEHLQGKRVRPRRPGILKMEEHHVLRPSLGFVPPPPFRHLGEAWPELVAAHLALFEARCAEDESQLGRFPESESDLAEIVASGFEDVLVADESGEDIEETPESQCEETEEHVSARDEAGTPGDRDTDRQEAEDDAAPRACDERAPVESRSLHDDTGSCFSQALEGDQRQPCSSQTSGRSNRPPMNLPLHVRQRLEGQSIARRQTCIMARDAAVAARWFAFIDSWEAEYAQARQAVREHRYDDAVFPPYTYKVCRRYNFDSRAPTAEEEALVNVPAWGGDVTAAIERARCETVDTWRRVAARALAAGGRRARRLGDALDELHPDARGYVEATLRAGGDPEND